MLSNTGHHLNDQPGALLPGLSTGLTMNVRRIALDGNIAATGGTTPNTRSTGDQ